MKVELITGSTGVAIALDDVKDWIRLERGYTEDDDLIGTMRDSAVNRCEVYLGRKLTPQTWRVYYDFWPGAITYPYRGVSSPNSRRVGIVNYFQLPFPPFRGLASSSSGVTYTDSNEAITELATTTFAIQTVPDPGRLTLRNNQSWPSTSLRDWDPIQIDFQCGYSSSNTAPAQVMTAIKMYIGDLYEHREPTIIGQGQTVVQLPYRVENMLRPFKSWHGAI